MKFTANSKWFRRLALTGFGALLMSSTLALSAPVTDWDDDGVSNEQEVVDNTNGYDALSSAKAKKRSLDMGKVNGGILLPKNERFNKSAFTVEMWILPMQRPDSVTGGVLYAIGEGEENGFVLSLVPDTADPEKLKVKVQMGDKSVVSATSFVTDAALIMADPNEYWTHIAVSCDYDAKTAKLYINGGLDDNGTLTLSSSIAKLSGKTPVIAKNFTSGIMDEFRFWSTAHTAADILSIKDCIVAKNDEYSDMEANYRFDDGGLSIEDFAYLPDYNALVNAGKTDDTDSEVIKAFAYRLTTDAAGAIGDKNNDGHFDWVTGQGCSYPEPEGYDYDADGDNYIGDNSSVDDWTDYAIIRAEDNTGDLETTVLSGDDVFYVSESNRIFVLPGENEVLDTIPMGADRVVAKAVFAKYLAEPEDNANCCDGLDNDGDGIIDDIDVGKELTDISSEQDNDDDGVDDQVETVRGSHPGHSGSIIVWNDTAQVQAWGQVPGTRVTQNWKELQKLIGGGDESAFNMNDFFNNTTVCAPQDDICRLFGSLNLGLLSADLELAEPSRFLPASGNGFTLEMWVKDMGVAEGKHEIFNYFNSKTGYGYRLMVEDGAPRAEIYDRDGNIISKAGGKEGNCATPALVKDVWTHLAMIWDPSNMVLWLYRDGVCEIGSDPVHMTVDFGTSGGEATLRKLDGLAIDEFRFWNVKRPQTAIEAWKDKVVPAPLWGLDGKNIYTDDMCYAYPLKAYFRFDDGGKTIDDLAYFMDRGYRLNVAGAVFSEGALALGGTDDTDGDGIPEWWMRQWGISKFNDLGVTSAPRDKSGNWRNYLVYNESGNPIGISGKQSGFTYGDIGSNFGSIAESSSGTYYPSNRILSTDISSVVIYKTFNLDAKPSTANLGIKTVGGASLVSIGVNGTTVESAGDIAKYLKVGRNYLMISWNQNLYYTADEVVGKDTYKRNLFKGSLDAWLTVDGKDVIVSGHLTKDNATYDPRSVWWYQAYTEYLGFTTFIDTEGLILHTSSGTVASYSKDYGVREDADGDGLNLYYEYLLNTNPWSEDSNNNGISDYNEDFDNDGAKNGEELQLGLDPRNADTDNDGYGDSEERNQASDPADWNSPLVHRALQLDGNGYLVLPNASRFALSTWTFEALVKPAEDNANGDILRRIVSTLDPEHVVYNYDFKLVDGKLTLVFSNTDGSKEEIFQATDIYTLPKAEWSHVAATFDGSSQCVNLYINGIKVYEGYSAIQPLTKSCGVVSVEAGCNFKGSIDELRIWNDVRTKAEIDGNRSMSLSGSEENLVGYYRFDDVNLEGRIAVNGEDYAYLKSAADSRAAAKGDWINNWASAGTLNGDAVVIIVDPEDDPLSGDGIDSDNDGMSDAWEIKYFGNLDQTGEGDYDGDDLSNYWEYKLGYDPTKKDTDGNGISDAQEDYDGDMLSNTQEVNIGLDPRNTDTDDDGADDYFEYVVIGSDPAQSLSQVNEDWTGIASFDEIARVLRLTGKTSMSVANNADQSGKNMTVAFWFRGNGWNGAEQPTITVHTGELNIKVEGRDTWSGIYPLVDPTATGFNRVWKLQLGVSNNINVAYNAAEQCWELKQTSTKGSTVRYYAESIDSAVDPWNLTWEKAAGETADMLLAEYTYDKAEAGDESVKSVTFLRRTVEFDNSTGINYAFGYDRDHHLTLTATADKGNAPLDILVSGVPLVDDEWYYVVGRISKIDGNDQYVELKLNVVKVLVDEENNQTSYSEDVQSIICKNPWISSPEKQFDYGQDGELQIGLKAADNIWISDLTIDLDNVYIWNDVLKDQEVMNLYSHKDAYVTAETDNTGIRQENLVSIFRFDDGGLTAEDFCHQLDWQIDWKHAGVIAPLDDNDEQQTGNHYEYGMIHTDVIPGSSTDSDNDGLPDDWEILNFGTLKYGSNDDPDNDGLSNREELRNDTDPMNPDSDGDGIKDGDEFKWGLDPNNSNDGSLDPDDDGLTNADECRYGTDPTNYDTDGDGLPDKFEVDNGYELRGQHLGRWLDANPPANLENYSLFLLAQSLGYGDVNGDGSVTDEEYRNITGPNGDSDGDGLTNLEEYQYGSDPLIRTAALTDADGDGLSNEFEKEKIHTLPYMTDTDDDEYDDMAEYASGYDPLDSSNKPSIVWNSGDGWMYEGNLVANLNAEHGFMTVPAAGEAGRFALGTWTIESRFRLCDIKLGDAEKTEDFCKRVYILRRSFLDNYDDLGAEEDTPFNYALGVEIFWENNGFKFQPFAAFRNKDASKEQIVRSIRAYSLKEDEENPGYYSTISIENEIKWMFLTGVYNPETRRLSLYVDGLFNSSAKVSLGKSGRATDIICPTMIANKVPAVRLGEFIPMNYEESGEESELQPRLQLDEVRIWGLPVENQVLTSQNEIASFVLSSADILYGAYNPVEPSLQVFDNSIGNRYRIDSASKGGLIAEEETYTVDARLDENNVEISSGIPGTPIYVRYHDWNGDGKLTGCYPADYTGDRDSIWPDLNNNQYLDGDEQIVAGNTSWSSQSFPSGLTGDRTLIYYYDADNSGTLTRGDYFWQEYNPEGKIKVDEANLEPWAKAMGLALYLRFDDGGGAIDDVVWHADWNSIPKRYKHAIRPADLPGVWPPKCGDVGGRIGESYDFDYAYVTSYFKEDSVLQSNFWDANYAWVVSIFANPTVPGYTVTALSNAPDKDQDGVVDCAYVPEDGDKLEFDILTADVDIEASDPEYGELSYRYFWLLNQDYSRNDEGICDELYYYEGSLYEVNLSTQKDRIVDNSVIVSRDSNLDLATINGLRIGDNLQLAVVAVSTTGNNSDVAITRNIEVKYSDDEYGVLEALEFVSFLPDEPVIEGTPLVLTLKNNGPEGTVYVQWFKNMNMVATVSMSDVETGEEAEFIRSGEDIVNGDVWGFKAYIVSDDRSSRSIPPLTDGAAEWIYRRVGVGYDYDNEEDANLNGAPTTPTKVKITPDVIYPTSMAFAEASGSVDPEGDTFCYYYQWKVNGQDVEGQNKQYWDGTVTEDDEISVSVYAVDIYGNRSAWKNSAIVKVTPIDDEGEGWITTDGPYEPNNAPESAKPILSKASRMSTSDPNIQTHGFETRADQDWISFVVPSNGTGCKRKVYFETNGGTMYQPNHNYYSDEVATMINLYRVRNNGRMDDSPFLSCCNYSEPNYHATVDYYGVTKYARFEKYLAPGVYYVQITLQDRNDWVSGMDYEVHFYLGEYEGDNTSNLPTWESDYETPGAIAELNPHDIVREDSDDEKEFAPPDEDLTVKLKSKAKSLTDNTSDIEYVYVWYRDGVVVPFGGENVLYDPANPMDYVLRHAKTLANSGSEPNLIDNSLTKSGEAWYCEVYAKDSNGYSDPTQTNTVYIGADSDRRYEWSAVFSTKAEFTSGKINSTDVTLGWSRNATFGFDAAIDVAAAPSKDATKFGTAYSIGYDNVNQALYTDLHPSSVGGSWYIMCKFGTSSMDTDNDSLNHFTISWDNQKRANGSVGDLTITQVQSDRNGVFKVVPNTTRVIADYETGSIEFTEEDIVSFQTDESGQRYIVFRVSLGGSDDLYMFDLEEGWNMVSLPITPINNAMSDVFGIEGKKVYSGNVYIYENGQYVVATNVFAGRGYWLYCPRDVDNLYCYGGLGMGTLSLTAGWNVIGPIYEITGFKALYNNRDYPGLLKSMTGNINGDGLQIYEFDPTTGSFIDTSAGADDFKLEVGKGYWIYTLSNVELPIVNQEAE